MSMRVVQRSPYFKGYYNRKLDSKNRYGMKLRNKEAMCAVVIKLIKVIFALFRDGRKFEKQPPIRLAIVV